ncbi:MAG: IclR family acetate operon transcriptional repressor [Gammaproteobacteria bacterium]|jgi:IclR family acetate operon transcriptional repressor
MRYRATRHAILTALSEPAGETCNIAYPDGSKMAYSDRVESNSPLKWHFPIGTRVPLNCTASGKLFLSTLSASRRLSIVQTIKLEKHAKNTITDSEQLLREINKIEKNRVSIDTEELYDGVVAVAVPITDKSGRFYGSLAIQAPAYRFDLDNKDYNLPLLREAARNLSTLTED